VTQTLRIGTRGSDLALWQARRIATRMEAELERPAELVIVKTQGDVIQNVAFHKMEGKGFFTKELQLALANGSVDLVVHSLKDLPTEEPDGLEVVAVPERHETADLLLARPGLRQVTPDRPLGLSAGAVLGTSSLRRAAQVLAMEPETTIRALRGNVPTRIGKLRDGLYDAIVVAAAGVGRLELELDDLEVTPLPPEVMLPAPGQGALAIETRVDSAEAAELRGLHDESVARNITAERGLLARLGGGCHLPLGCLATAEPDGAVRLQAVLGAVDEELTRAAVSRVGACAPTPVLAAEACFQALEATRPEPLLR
jgi:hydroxymethylbilane synthase